MPTTTGTPPTKTPPDKHPAGFSHPAPSASTTPHSSASSAPGNTLGGGDDGHGGGAAAGYQVAEQGQELALFLLGAQHGGEDGDLVEDRGDDGQAVGGFDLAAAVGAEPGVPVFHHLLQPEQGDDGAADVGSDELVGGGVHGVQQAGFAAAGFARGEQVLVDQADVEGLAEFVAAHVDRVIHGQHRPDRDSASCGCGAGHGGSPCGEAGNPRPGRAVAWGSSAWVVGASRAAG